MPVAAMLPHFKMHLIKDFSLVFSQKETDEFEFTKLNIDKLLSFWNNSFIGFDYLIWRDTDISILLKKKVLIKAAILAKTELS